MSDIATLAQSPAPSAPGVTEDVLTGARVLRRALLAAPLLNLDRGADVIRTSEREPPLCLVRRGYVFRHHDMANGRRAIVDVLIPGDIIGLDHIVLARSGADFCAATKLSYNALATAAVRTLIRDNATVSFHLLGLLAEARWRVERLATTVMRLEARERIAALILGIYQRLRRHGLINGLSFNLPFTQEELGDHLGLTFVHVNRTLRRLREEGLVIVDRQVVMILDYDRLSDLLTGALTEPVYMPSPMMPDLPSQLDLRAFSTTSRSGTYRGGARRTSGAGLSSRSPR